MKLLKPTLHCGKVTDISGEMLEKMQVKAILLDVDNTLTSYTSKKPITGTIEWVHHMEEQGYRVYIVSNNFKERVSHIASLFSLPFVSFALKPFPLGFKKARDGMGIHSRDCLVVGDQIFTDILGANLGGMQSVLVDPIELEKGFTFEIRRYFERFIRPKCKIYSEKYGKE